MRVPIQTKDQEHPKCQLPTGHVGAHLVEGGLIRKGPDSRLDKMVLSRAVRLRLRYRVLTYGNKRHSSNAGRKPQLPESTHRLLQAPGYEGSGVSRVQFARSGTGQDNNALPANLFGAVEGFHETYNPDVL